MTKIVNCDYLVIGSGSGGSVAFRELAKDGKDVLLVEEGYEWKKKDFDAPISELTQKIYRGGGITPFLGNPPIGFGEGVALGGSTVINGGLLWRTPKWILDEWHNKGITGYQEKDLSPYFDEIESSLNVKKEIELVSYDLDSQIIGQSAEELGWKVVDTPRATINCSRKNQCGAGCPSGAKQSVDKTYIHSGKEFGGRVLTGIKIEHLKKTKGRIDLVIGMDLQTRKKIIFKCKVVFLAAGAINTPLLLKRGKISKSAGKRLQFHINLKVFAKFPNKIAANKGTIFTRQVQEYEKEGLLIMGTNYNLPYLATTLSHLENDLFNEYFRAYENSAIYTPMIKPVGSAKIYDFFGETVIKHNLDPVEDLCKLRKALKVTSKLMFNAGAQVLILPLEGSKPVFSYLDAIKVIKQAALKKFQMLSVHAMSSCAMGINDQNVCDLNGKVRGIKNLYICDASVLPTNIGESPQGTIMAFSHMIVDRYLNKIKVI
ncbi:GMC family oxidoreductase [Methylophilaceae bacterium]|nr:GMC family oxidoreductase [Methylophilaceae bacterium]